MLNLFINSKMLSNCRLKNMFYLFIKTINDKENKTQFLLRIFSLFIEITIFYIYPINMIMHFNASTQIILHTVIYITHCRTINIPLWNYTSFNPGSHLRHKIVDEVTSMDLWYILILRWIWNNPYKMEIICSCSCCVGCLRSCRDMVCIFDVFY